MDPRERSSVEQAADPLRELHQRVANADLDFAAVVRQRRATMGVTSERLAKVAELSPARLREIEHGQTPNLTELLLLSHALGLRVSIDSELNLRVVSLPAALSELDRLAQLPADWDSYGAAPPTDTAIVQARRIVEVLTPLLVSMAGHRGDPWAVAARVDGGIQIEWDGEAGAVEVHVGPDGMLGYLIERRQNGDVAYEEREPVSLVEVYETLVQLLAA